MKRDAATQAPDRIARVESRPARPPGVGAKHFRDMGRALRRMVDCHRRLVDLGYPLLQPVEAYPAPMDAPRAKKPRRPAMPKPKKPAVQGRSSSRNRRSQPSPTHARGPASHCDRAGFDGGRLPLGRLVVALPALRRVA